MSISGFIFKLVLIQSLLYYILLLRQIASLPADLATGGGLTARFPPVERSWCTRILIRRDWVCRILEKSGSGGK